MKTKTFIILLLIIEHVFYAKIEMIIMVILPMATLHNNIFKWASDTSMALNTQWMDPGATAIDDVIVVL